MENIKHTQAYAEKLALESFPEKSHGSRDLEIAIENSKIGFIKGYMKALEEAAAPDMLEALIEAKKELEYHNWQNTYTYNQIVNAITKSTKQH